MMDLLLICTNTSDKIFERRLIQIYNDGSSLNLKFCNDLFQDRNENRLPQLVNIGTSGLHVAKQPIRRTLKRVSGS